MVGEKGQLMALSTYTCKHAVLTIINSRAQNSDVFPAGQMSFTEISNNLLHYVPQFHISKFCVLFSQLKLHCPALPQYRNLELPVCIWISLSLLFLSLGWTNQDKACELYDRFQFVSLTFSIFTAFSLSHLSWWFTIIRFPQIYDNLIIITDYYRQWLKSSLFMNE